jgi:hypothetical protein
MSYYPKNIHRMVNAKPVAILARREKYEIFLSYFCRITGNKKIVAITLNLTCYPH